tara:strand:+ start:1400 stop:1618 length:219 start_codon:yes stop_codon:yes gene_type:complete
MDRGDEKRWREDFYGSDLKDYEEKILEDAADLAVFEYLEIKQEIYQASLARGELRSLNAEAQIEMLNFLKAK